ncbi:uncharacterized protein PV09_02980 [Verruconis gallopava]|uniref:Ribosomal RNA-processing protein 42 n=1 Tax=Verruconis gallopava TaxID=253628 RepID=A0A0D2AJ48_9PEZI|nr:uncharacterized protein PV09_02980 [Verruconis gallopava]KIW06550.1 hypothetical protein PV09_02980 [Verruconis gallopava]
MAPATSVSQQFLLSPAELSFLHSSLSLVPPIRPDGRSPTQFRPLVAESGILPAANGSARVCFADGTEAIVGVKAEVEKSSVRPGALGDLIADEAEDDDDVAEDNGNGKQGAGESGWVELSIEVPGYRDDDALPIFLSAMLTEALVADGRLKDRLWINRRFHWKLSIDILLLSAPLTYPLPLLSITTHLALLSARLPKLISEGDEDPLFDDDWDASTYLYPLNAKGERMFRPAITLLVMSVGPNFIFDPSKEELAVADGVLAVSAGMTEAASLQSGTKLRLLSLRTIDPPSRLSPPGLPNALNHIAMGTAPLPPLEAFAAREATQDMGVWNPPRGGIKRQVVAQIVKAVLEPGGVAEEVMEGLVNVAT